LSAIPYNRYCTQRGYDALGGTPECIAADRSANVNCRIFPGDDPEEVRKTLERVVADPKVKVTVVAAKTSDGKLIPIVAVPPSLLLPEVTTTLEKTLATMGRVPVVPSMSTGATDGKYCESPGCRRMEFRACF
jgi:acetylornithine deacetylase/succinyl-diaminopimelate desuccinylase-like protein